MFPLAQTKGASTAASVQQHSGSGKQGLRMSTLKNMSDDTLMAERQAATPHSNGSSSGASAVPMDLGIEPCSQLLEDTPMELWDFEGSAVINSKETNASTVESELALQQLEDFCKCMADTLACIHTHSCAFPCSQP